MKNLVFSLLFLGVVGTASAQTTPPDSARQPRTDTLVQQAAGSKDSVFSQRSTSSNNAQADSVKAASTDSLGHSSQPVQGTDSTHRVAGTATGAGSENLPADADKNSPKTKTKIKTAEGQEIKIKSKNGETKVKKG